MSYTLLDLIRDHVRGPAVEISEDVEHATYQFIFEKAAERLSVEAEEFTQAHCMNFENDPEYVQGYYNGILQAARLLRMVADE